MNPALGLTYQACHAAGDWGFTPAMARERGLLRELEISVDTFGQMRKRGIRVLPGGDYGFAWNPHGTYARDLLLFVDVLGFTPSETLVAATRLGGEIMGLGGELGQVKAGYLADLLLVDGNPLDDIKLLQNQDALLAIMKDGRLHKAPAGLSVTRGAAGSPSPAATPDPRSAAETPRCPGGGSRGWRRRSSATPPAGR